MRSATAGRTPIRCGFTLIELLVVISIVALLIALLLPALGKARMTAKAVACLSNIRQIGIGVIAYTGDHRNHLPLNGGLENFHMGGNTGFNSWAADRSEGWFLVAGRKRQGSTSVPEGTAYAGIGAWKCPGREAPIYRDTYAQYSVGWNGQKHTFAGGGMESPTIEQFAAFAYTVDDTFKLGLPVQVVPRRHVLVAEVQLTDRGGGKDQWYATVAGYGTEAHNDSFNALLTDGSGRGLLSPTSPALRAKFGGYDPVSTYAPTSTSGELGTWWWSWANLHIGGTQWP